MTYAFKLFFPVDDSVMCSRTMTSLCALYWVFKCFSLRATFPYRLDGLVVRASAFQLQDWGSNPIQVIQKTCRMGAVAFLFGAQHKAPSTLCDSLRRDSLRRSYSFA